MSSSMLSVVLQPVVIAWRPRHWLSLGAPPVEGERVCVCVEAKDVVLMSTNETCGLDQLHEGCHQSCWRNFGSLCLCLKPDWWETVPDLETAKCGLEGRQWAAHKSSCPARVGFVLQQRGKYRNLFLPDSLQYLQQSSGGHALPVLDAHSWFPSKTASHMHASAPVLLKLHKSNWLAQSTWGFQLWFQAAEIAIADQEFPQPSREPKEPQKKTR